MLRRLAPYLSRRKRVLLVSIAQAVLWAGTVAAVPVIQGRIIDDAIADGAAAVAPMLALLGAIAIARLGLSAGWRYNGGKLGFLVQDDVRRDVYDRLQRLDVAGHERLESGQLVSRTSSDLRYVAMLLNWAPQVAGILLSGILSISIMTVLSPVVAVLALTAIAAVFAVTTGQQRKVYAAAWDAQDREATAAGRVEEAVTGVRVIRAFAQEEAEAHRLHRALRDMFVARVRAARLRAPLLASMQGAPVAGQVVVLTAGGVLVARDQLTVGALVACLGYLTELIVVFRVAAMVLTNAPLCRAAMERVGELLDLRPRIAEPLHPAEVDGRDHALTFRRVRLARGDGEGQQAVSGFTLDVRSGETVALIGRPGCGKSSVLMLVPRLLDPDEGVVEVAGHDVRNWPLHALRGRIGLVSDTSFLFSGTIGENIAFGRPDVGVGEIRAAARLAAAADFIEALADGYDTVVGPEGITLSGGQRQRIALARALLVQPDILLLDDATSSVDVEVEDRIHDNLLDFLAQRTVLMVARRPSSLSLADRIVVMDDGRVVDQGTHADLSRRSALYRDLLGIGRPVHGEALDGPDGVEVRRTGPADAAWRRRGAGPDVPDVKSRIPVEVADQIARLPDKADPLGVDFEHESKVTGDLRWLSLLRPRLREILIGLGLVLLEVAVLMVNPMLVRAAVDGGMLGGSTTVLVTTCSCVAGLAAGLWWVQRTGLLWTSRTAERLLLALRLRISGQLQRMGIDYYDRTLPGQIMTRMTADVDAIAQLFQVGLIYGVVSVLSFAGMLVVVLLLDPLLALVVCAGIPLMALSTWWYWKRAARAYDEAQEYVALLNSDVQESVQGIRVTQAYGREATNLRRFAAIGRAYVTASLRGLFATSVFIAIIEFLTLLAVIAVLGVGAGRVESGALQVGTLIAFVLYIVQVYLPIEQLSNVFDLYHRANAGFARIRKLAATVPSTLPPHGPGTITRIRGAISFREVRLRYPGTDFDAIRGVVLDIPAGQRVGVVGRTGAGKSSVSKLLVRFYDPTSGRVLIDGVPLRMLDLGRYRDQLGYVPQEPFLFARSIRDNIAYGCPGATDSDIETVARSIGAHEFVTRMPSGYHHVLADRGLSLSAGERQMICLARALLGDPAILILDEATSNLDSAAERRISQALRATSEGRTTIVITHRPQALDWLDRVITLSDGRIAADEPAAAYFANGAAAPRATCMTRAVMRGRGG